MFRNNTVFVLGAGASWHYGYPTGEALVENVISMAKRLFDYCEWRLKSGLLVQVIPKYIVQKIDQSRGIESARAGWVATRDECQLLIDRLETVRPLVIDYFLAWNETLRPIGKLMISAAILECEAIWLSERANHNRRLMLANAPMKPSAEDLRRIDIKKYRDDWYRFIVHKLVYGCQESADLFKNDVRFITFNYDTSLEYHLFKALTAIDMLKLTDVEKFLADDRIIHVYGSVHSAIPSERDAIDLKIAKTFGQHSVTPVNPAVDFEPRSVLLDRCLVAANNLRTIDPHDKEEDEASLRRAQQWIENSNVVYILGYSFDENNSRRIGINPLLRVTVGSKKSVMFTNYGNVNTVNKNASKLFYGSYDKFLDKSAHGNPKMGDYVEKSVRTVYEALEMDFGALEGELIEGSRV